MKTPTETHTEAQQPADAGCVGRLVSGSVWVTIRDRSGVDHGPMRVCWVENWEKASPAEKVLWVHRRCKKATGGNPFDFIRVEYREDPPIPRSTRRLNEAWTKAMTNIHNSFR